MSEIKIECSGVNRHVLHLNFLWISFWSLLILGAELLWFWDVFVLPSFNSVGCLLLWDFSEMPVSCECWKGDDIIRVPFLFRIECLEFYLCCFHGTKGLQLRTLLFRASINMLKNMLLSFLFFPRSVVKSLPVLNAKFDLVLIEMNLPLPQYCLILCFHDFFRNHILNFLVDFCKPLVIILQCFCSVLIKYSIAWDWVFIVLVLALVNISIWFRDHFYLPFVDLRKGRLDCYWIKLRSFIPTSSTFVKPLCGI